MARKEDWVSDIEGIVFDLDNTLYDRDANVRTWLETIFAANPRLAEAAAAFDDCGFIPRGDFYEWVRQRVDWAETALDVKLRFQGDILKSIKPDSRINGLIRRLAERFVLGVLTNGESEYQLAKFRALGIGDCFHPSRVLVTEAVGVHKPEPAAFEAIIRAMETPASRLLFVGDNPLNDIEGAAGVGMKTCWIQLRPEHHCSVTPDLRVHSILELQEMLGNAELVGRETDDN
jgi:putative hydrolase of the HAD superfamily